MLYRAATRLRDVPLAGDWLGALPLARRCPTTRRNRRSSMVAVELNLKGEVGEGFSNCVYCEKTFSEDRSDFVRNVDH